MESSSPSTHSKSPSRTAYSKTTQHVGILSIGQLALILEFQYEKCISYHRDATVGGSIHMQNHNSRHNNAHMRYSFA